jgi:hypothetical protein
LAQLSQIIARHRALFEDRLTIYFDGAVVGLFKQIHATHEGCLAAPALADNADDPAGWHIQVDPIEHKSSVERFSKAPDLDC